MRAKGAWRGMWPVVLLGIALHLLLALRPDGVVHTGRLPDTDAYVRTMRVERLYATGAWFDITLPGLNASEGLSMHWTRPVDVLILGPALAAMHLGGVAPRAAIFWAGALLSPVLHILCALAAAWAARALWPGGAVVAALAVMVNPVLLFAYGAFGQTDHHMLVLLAVILALGGSLRAILAPGALGAAGLAGAALGLGIWVSPEVLLVAAPLLGGFGAVWVLRGGAPVARQGLRIALAMLAVIALGVAIERPPSDWLLGEYDRISAHHAVIALLASSGFAVLAMVPARLGLLARLAVGGAVAAAAAGVLLALYPQALRASEAAADAGTAALFLPYVAEMKPLHATFEGAHDLVLYAGGLLPALLLVLAVPGLWRGRRWPAWVLAGLVLATCALATLLHRRFAADLAAITAIFGAGLIWLAQLRNRAAPPALRAARLATAALLAVGLPYAGLLLPGDAAARDAARECDWGGLATWLATAPLPGTAPIIMTDSWRATPEMAYRTPYRFIVSPYHRAGAAFRDTVDAMRATDDATAQQVLARRGAAYVLVCVGQRPANLGPYNADSLEARLREQRLPAWLAPIALPPALDAMFRLVLVIK